MSIEGQGHFFTIYFPGFVCFVLYNANISGERLQDHWSSGSLNIIWAPALALYSETIPSLTRYPKKSIPKILEIAAYQKDIPIACLYLIEVVHIG